jgi:hypothetical protein
MSSEEFDDSSSSSEESEYSSSGSSESGIPPVLVVAVPDKKKTRTKRDVEQTSPRSPSLSQIGKIGSVRMHSSDRKIPVERKGLIGSVMDVCRDVLTLSVQNPLNE